MQVAKIEVLEKSVSISGETTLVSILRMRGGEYLTYAQAAELLGTTSKHISNTLARVGMSPLKVGELELIELKEKGEIASRTPSLNLIDKEGLKLLVKVLNTSEAWTVYEQLWGVTERAFQVHSGNISPIDLFKSLLAAFEQQSLQISVLDQKQQHLETKVETHIQKSETVIDMLGSGDNFHTVAKKAADPYWKPIIKDMTAGKVGKLLATITKENNLERKTISHPAYPKGIGAYSDEAWTILKDMLNKS